MTTRLTLDVVAALEGISERHARRRALAGRYGEIHRTLVGRNGQAMTVSLDHLSAPARARYRDEHPEERPSSSATCEELPIISFDLADPRQKHRALLRRDAVDAYQQWLAAFGARRGLKAARAAWTESYKAQYPTLQHLSPASIQRWSASYAAFGLDGLVDRNDGSARRGHSKLPDRVRETFIARYTDGTCPSKAMVIEETRTYAREQLGISLDHVADDAFHRIEIPEGLRRLTREDQDHEERLILTLRRDHGFPAMHIVVADHHITDLWVHCGQDTYLRQSDRLVHVPAPSVCEGECRHGHRVWITAWMDVASRKVVSWFASLEYPSSETVRHSLRELIARYGLPSIVYVDNGKDFKSAFGKAIRRGEAMPLPENVLNNLLASLGVRVIFARPRKGRSKSIERLFGTWVRTIWQGRPEYVGALGQRRESAKQLYSRPDLLLSLGQFREELALHIEAYNLRRGHKGQGMNGRSPEEVFEATRVRPERRPEPNGFALAFWRWYGRKVGPGGACVVGADRYILDPIVTPTVLGRNVQLLVNPDDVRRAIVVSGCAHTDSRTSRVKSIACDCPGKGRFLCEATFEGLSSYVDHEVTSSHLRERDRINRELRQQIRTYRSESAARDLVAFRRGGRLLQAIVERRRAQHQPAVAMAAGAEAMAQQQPAPVSTILPQSHIARHASDYRAAIERPSPLTPLQLAVAATAEDYSDSYIDALLDHQQHGEESNEFDDALAFEAERDRIAAMRERARKTTEGECLDCDAPVWAGQHCQQHYRLSD